MLFLLRKIRRKLISPDNKAVTYLLYAVGEIFLVVVGILIAVSIDDWKEDQIKREKRVVFLQNLQSDYETNLENIDPVLHFADSIYQSSNRFLTLAGALQINVPMDTLYHYASSTRYFANFTPLNATYKTAQATGDIGLIQDKELLELFIRYQENHDYFKLHFQLAGENIFKGGYWELRQKIASLTVIFPEDAEDPLPERFRKSESELKALLLDPEFYALCENMKWLQRNGYTSLLEMKKINVEILSKINALLKSSE